ncbi:hypothetical protein PybrP1_007144 [[Pythium] brassicae (nom. inval.)]|nr:hypothetical protein PybrP1_007144 [[Pythium] brassicae (nom. inval.)]
MAGENKADGIPEGEAPIQNTYTFWYIKRNAGNKAESYEKSIKELGEFKTVQGFWRMYNHMMRPNDLPNTMDYHLFKTGIKPMWEDNANRRGGKWMVRLRKGIASRYWEDLVLGIIGEQFDVGNEICGAVISVRYNEDIISLWNRNADNSEALRTIRDKMQEVLNLPHFVSLEYKRHDASLTDNSSFRNTTLWRSDSGKVAGDGGSASREGQRSSGHRSSGTAGANQKDAVHRGGERVTAVTAVSVANVANVVNGGGTASANKPRSFTKSASSTGEDVSGGSERASSSDRPNAWQQK